MIFLSLSLALYISFLFPVSSFLGKDIKPVRINHLSFFFSQEHNRFWTSFEFLNYSQDSMAEEHRCQTPEGHRLCANNCGFLGSSATMNLCSNCYVDLCLKQQQQASMKSTVESSLSSVSPPSSKIASISSPMIQPLVQNPSAESELTAKKVPMTITVTEQQQKRPNRCTTCRKRVGLTGFKCRCGTTFCGAHRYPEVHGCTFDFKSAGREEIARANPLVKAAKLQKI